MRYFFPFKPDEKVTIRLRGKQLVTARLWWSPTITEDYHPQIIHFDDDARGKIISEIRWENEAIRTPNASAISSMQPPRYFLEYKSWHVLLSHADLFNYRNTFIGWLASCYMAIGYHLVLRWGKNKPS